MNLSIERWQQLKPWLERLLDLAPEQRPVWLQRECADPDLAEELLELITTSTGSAHDTALERIREGVLIGSENHGQRVGPFIIERRLGEGGMGIVFLARRAHVDYEQRVALKLMRSELCDSAELQRFRRERRILARLTHPGIARLVEGGVTERGLPYLAMEYVDGESITHYCDRHHLDLRARLALFAEVCSAVMFAHQNLVVHRDLKPANILIDRHGRPRLLDFGIAKLLDAGIEDDERTHTAMRRFTAGYAAPEQFDGTPPTTATDIYSLGAVLFELLTGARPPRADRDILPSFEQALDPDAARLRSSTPAALRRALRGDVRSIVQHALHRDPLQRYESAAALRDDVLRHLHGRIVKARAGVRRYRLLHAVRRYRLPLASLTALLLILITATLFSLHQARVAANQARHAQAESTRAQAIHDFVLALFEAAAPDNADVDDSVDALIAKGIERSATQLHEQPELQIDLLATLADIQRRRSRIAEAKPPLQEALRLARNHLGDSDPRTLRIAVLLAGATDALGDFPTAIEQLDLALSAYQAAGGPTTDAQVAALTSLTRSLAKNRELERAAVIGEEAVRRAEQLQPPNNGVLANALDVLGYVYRLQRRHEHAAALLRRALELSRGVLGHEHTDLTHTMSSLAMSLSNLGEIGEAETLLRDALNIQLRASRGLTTSRAGLLMNELSVVLLSSGKVTEALSALQESIANATMVLPAGHPDFATMNANLGGLLFQLGEHEHALDTQLEGLRLRIAVAGDGSPYVPMHRRSLAETLLALGRIDEAQEQVDLALAALPTHSAPRSLIRGQLHTVQAQIRLQRGEASAAVVDALEALDQLSSGRSSSRHMQSARNTLIDALLLVGNADEALRIAMNMIDAASQTRPPVAATLALAHANRAAARRSAGDEQAAAEAQRSAWHHLHEAADPRFTDARLAREKLAGMAAATP